MSRYAHELVEGGFAVEVADAPLLHDGLNVADVAHVLVLRERGVIPDAAARRLLGVLRDAVATPVAEFGYDPAHGEVYNCRERRFAAAIGRDAGWLHAGRPRREAVRIALRLRVRRDVGRPRRGGRRVRRSPSPGWPTRTPRPLMVDQTYLQHAQPSTFGHFLLGSAYPVLRDDRPAHSRASTGSTAARRARAGSTAARSSATGNAPPALLGFDGVIEHTRDAMWQSDGLHRGWSGRRHARHDPRPRSPRTWRSEPAREFGWVGPRRRPHPLVACSCRRSATRTR